MAVAAIPTQTLSAQQLGGATSSSGGTWKAYIKERHADVVALGDALQSGDLSGAQQAYNKLVTLGNTLSGDNPFIRSDRALDFNAIGGALANGNLSQAQQAFTTLRDTFAQKLPPVGTPPSPDAVVKLSSIAAPTSTATPTPAASSADAEISAPQAVNALA